MTAQLGGWKEWILPCRSFVHIETGATVFDSSLWPFFRSFGVKDGSSNFLGYFSGSKAAALFRLMKQRAEEQRRMEEHSHLATWLQAAIPTEPTP